MNRRAFALTLTALCCTSGTVFAQPIAFSEGQDFVAVDPPVSTDAPKGSVEVLEFFSYHCPACARLDPALNEWVKKLPKGVAFRRSPVVFQPGWAIGARLFFALDASNQLEKFHTAIMQAVHQQRLPILASQASATEWIGKNGGDVQALTTAWNSFFVQSRMARAESQAKAYPLSGVPSLAVDGRYISQPENRGDPLLLANHMIQLARDAKPRK